MKFLKKTLKVVSILVLITLSVVLFRTFNVKSRQIESVQEVNLDIDMDKASRNLSKALQCKTISYTDPEQFDYDEFIKIHKLIDDMYPEVKKNLDKEIINNYSLIYTWKGSNESLKPIILCGHLDAVGVEENTLDQWKHEPFSGDIENGIIYGRGARDNKCQVFSILEGVEYLLNSGYVPERTIYLAFGHDEEVTGINGAQYIAKHLEEKGVEAECVIDEGGAIVNNAVPGVHKSTVLIGIAEKGYMTVKISADLDGGHSSDPADKTSINSVCRAVTKISDYSFDETLEQVKPMFEFAASEADFPMKAAYSNLWLTGGILKNIMNSSPESASLIKTTKVATVFNAGFKDNYKQYIEVVIQLIKNL